MHPVGEQATHILSPDALHTGYKLSPHDNITIVSLDKAAWTDQSCALFTGTLLLQKKKKNLSSVTDPGVYTLLFRTCCLELGYFSIFLGPQHLLSCGIEAESL